MSELVISDDAEIDLKQVFNYLASHFSCKTVERYYSELDSLYVQLKLFPESGAPRPRIGKTIRIGIINPYLVLYRYDSSNNTVTILRVVDGRRRIGPGLLRDRNKQH